MEINLEWISYILQNRGDYCVQRVKLKIDQDQLSEGVAVSSNLPSGVFFTDHMLVSGLH